MSIDLHCHTRFSDGSTPLAEVLELAKLRGVDTLAITDHDTMAGCEEAQRLGEKLGVRVIPAVEISARDEQRQGKAHILCYAPERPEALYPLLERILESRRNAMECSIRRVTELFPVSREMILKRVEGSTCIYKQHVMQALMDAGLAAEMFGELYRKLYDSKTGAAYFDVDYPTIPETFDAIKRAGGRAVLAHPSEYHNMELLQELAEAGLLDGVEINHPRNLEEDRVQMHSIAQRFSLAETGGTDFHGFYTTRKNPIGAYTTGPAELHQLLNNRKE